jgi:hypothetical protein
VHRQHRHSGLSRDLRNSASEAPHRSSSRSSALGKENDVPAIAQKRTDLRKAIPHVVTATDEAHSIAADYAVAQQLPCDTADPPIRWSRSKEVSGPDRERAIAHGSRQQVANQRRVDQAEVIGCDHDRTAGERLWLESRHCDVHP